MQQYKLIFYFTQNINFKKYLKIKHFTNLIKFIKTKLYTTYTIVFDPLIFTFGLHFDPCFDYLWKGQTKCWTSSSSSPIYLSKERKEVEKEALLAMVIPRLCIHHLVLVGLLLLLSTLTQSVRFDLQSAHTKCIAEDIRADAMTVGNYKIINPNEPNHPMPDSHKITVRVIYLFKEKNKKQNLFYSMNPTKT